MEIGRVGQDWASTNPGLARASPDAASNVRLRVTLFPPLGPAFWSTGFGEAWIGRP
jgi:hypothetical protein